MKIGFYSKLAWNGIRKNSRIYLPYILTGIVMIMMYYIISFLSYADVVEHMEGGGVLRTLLPVGQVVIGMVSLTFLFYSNSFLLKQRNKEFGLYHVLGMNKGNLSKIIFYENTMIAGLSILTGLVFGIACSKLTELCMLNLLQEEIDYVFRLDVRSIVETLLIYSGIYVLLFFHAVIKVYRSNSMELLRSDQIGEKAPRANWLLAVCGLVMLAVAYYIAISIKQPLTAIVWFIVAVVLVIVATYLIFIAVSVALCRILQKNKNYYYKANHFVSVSSMVYRMKRNGAGLASICVLITIVLVMLTSTISLYAGAEDSLKECYPKDVAMRLFLPGMDDLNEETCSKMKEEIDAVVPEKEHVTEYAGTDIAGLFTETGILVDQSAIADFDLKTYENVGYLQVISLEDYNRLMGTTYTLETGECFLHCYRTEYKNETFTIEHCPTLKVKRILEEMYVSTYAAVQLVPTITLVTSDIHQLLEPVQTMENAWGQSILQVFWSYSFDLDMSKEEQIAVCDKVFEKIRDVIIPDVDGSYSYSFNCKAQERNAFYGIYAGLFFIAIFMSIVFLFVAVLIIYYKQISEGYEDKNRFEIMQKVGMTKQEIRKTINSQVMTVFFLPLLFAGLHLGFAFPIIWKLLQLFNFHNLPLMIGVTVLSFLVFAVVYGIVYKITSNAYYRMVSDRE